MRDDAYQSSGFIDYRKSTDVILQHAVCRIDDRCVGIDGYDLSGHDLMRAHFTISWLLGKPISRRGINMPTRHFIDAALHRWQRRAREIDVKLMKSLYLRRLVRHLGKSGMGNRYRSSLGAAHNVNPGFELLGERVDDAGAQAGFCLRKDTNRRADPVVRNRKLPIRSGDGESDGYLTIGSVVGEGVLERIQYEFGDDQAEAYGLTRGHVPASLATFSVVGR